MTPDADRKARTEACKAALCAEIVEEMGFDPSNVAFAPNFTPDAVAEFEKLCSGVCGACPIQEAAEAMRAARLAPKPAQ